MKKIILLNLLMIFLVLNGVGCTSTTNNIENINSNESSQKEIILAEEEELLENQEKNEEQEDTARVDGIERENIIGTSNKNFKDITTSKPTTVRNDVTGNWKLSRISTSENILEYIRSYYKDNFNNDEEIHAIVNFSLNTTTQVSKLLDNILSVTIFEYVDKEEHDAKKLFTGMVLKEYWIYLDNGDIEEIQ